MLACGFFISAGDRMRKIQFKIEMWISDAETPFFVVVACSSLSHSAIYSISTLCFLSFRQGLTCIV